MIGKKLAHYEIVEKIGAGGMGEVYRASDSQLGRDVALKMLPAEFAQDAERMARFRHEAHILASLNHPNIATIHGLHEEQEIHFLSMELVPGENVAERLTRGPVPLEESLRLARQMLDALAFAHAGGVVHRDFKPGNIRVKPDGAVKVLDFGLAKALETSSAPSDAAATLPPTATSPQTGAGVVLGTAGYMSPEQVRGAAVDQRSDLWSFGCVLYEMLTGRRVFTGATTSDSRASALHTEPDWSALPRETPGSIRRLLRRCLEKDVECRLHSAADARLEIEDAMSGKAEPSPVDVAEQRRRRRWIPWAIAALFAVVAVAVAIALRERPEQEPLHLAVALPLELELKAALSGELIAALSPDGKRVAITAREKDTIRLYLRSLDSPNVVAVPETEGASGPFFSPDGQWVAFFAEGMLKKVAVQGGTPVVLCHAPSGRGGCWVSDDTIVLTPAYTSGLARIPATGGEPEPFTTPDASRNERTHRWPDALPGGRSIVFTIGTLDQPGYYEDATLAVTDLESGRVRALIEGGSFVRHSPTGHLIYSREGSLLAVPFDADNLEVTGPPIPLLDGVARETTSGAVHYAVSRKGTLMYVPAGATSPEVTMAWVDREGRVEPIRRTPRPYIAPRLSPDGTKVAIGVGPGLGDGDIWVHDLVRATSTRLTFESDYLAPIWTPDGKRVVFGVTRGGSEGIAWKAADGSDAEEMIFREESGAFVAEPEAWLSGTDTIVYARAGGSGSHDVMAVVRGETAAQTILGGPTRDGGTSFSPDGRWMAYCSNESGRFEVYVRSFSGTGGKWQLSIEGGKGPVWSRDGREIFFTNGSEMMVVAVEIEPTFSHGPPRELFELEFQRGYGTWPDYDVAPDGQRFLMFLRSHDDQPPRQVDIVTNFAAKLGG